MQIKKKNERTTYIFKYTRMIFVTLSSFALIELSIYTYPPTQPPPNTHTHTRTHSHTNKVKVALRPRFHASVFLFYLTHLYYVHALIFILFFFFSPLKFFCLHLAIPLPVLIFVCNFIHTQTHIHTFALYYSIIINYLKLLYCFKWFHFKWFFYVRAISFESFSFTSMVASEWMNTQANEWTEN